MNSKDRKARAEAVRALRGKGIGVDVRRRQILRVYGTPPVDELEAWLLRGKFGFHEQQVIAP